MLVQVFPVSNQGAVQYQFHPIGHFFFNIIRLWKIKKHIKWIINTGGDIPQKPSRKTGVFLDIDKIQPSPYTLSN
jgi:hypothetical protein